MGNLLGAPITEKETHRGVTKDEKLKFGLSSMQGWRVHMEDAHIAEGDMHALEVVGDQKTKIPLKGHALFAVYDGHGGTFAAIYSGKNFLRVLSKQPRFVQYAKMCAEETESADATTSRAAKMQLLEQALKQAFVETDYEIGLAINGRSHADANSPYHEATPKGASTTGTTNSSACPSDEDAPTTPAKRHSNGQALEGVAMKAASDQLAAMEDEGDSGTTSCVVMITPDSIVCANAGDSRAVFARRPETPSPQYPAVGKAIPLSFDHKPDDEEEELRVRNAGGYVAGGRVEGDLAVSRGLGDFRFKQMAVVLNNTQLYPDTDATAAASTTTTTDMATDDEGDGDDHSTNNTNSRTPLIFPPGDQKVSPIPDVTIHSRNHERDEYVVVACDGIWDVVSNQRCIEELDKIMYAEGERDLGLVSEEVLDLCLQYGSKDNMTAIVVQLPGCEKSYENAEKKSTASKSTEANDDSVEKQEGVAGRRRKREEEINAAVAAQQGGGSPE